jgi:hypothetical protein
MGRSVLRPYTNAKSDELWPVAVRPAWEVLKLLHSFLAH